MEIFFEEGIEFYWGEGRNKVVRGKRIRFEGRWGGVFVFIENSIRCIVVILLLFGLLRWCFGCFSFFCFYLDNRSVFSRF